MEFEHPNQGSLLHSFRSGSWSPASTLFHGNLGRFLFGRKHAGYGADLSLYL